MVKEREKNKKKEGKQIKTKTEGYTITPSHRQSFQSYLGSHKNHKACPKFSNQNGMHLNSL